MTADELQKFLDTLGQKLTPAASHLWELAVRQQAIWGWASLIILGVWTILLIVVAHWALRKCNDRGAGEAIVAGMIIVSIFLIPTLLVTAVNGIGNPEYAALKDLVSQIKP